MKVKKGDTVLITSGKDKGKKGKVITAIPRISKVVIEGVSLRKKHVRPKKSGEKGQIVSLPSPISVSNVKVICSKCNKAAKISFKVIGNKKNRVCKKCNQEI